MATVINIWLSCFETFVRSFEFIRITADHLLRNVDLFHQTNLSRFDDSPPVKPPLTVGVDNRTVRYNLPGRYDGPRRDGTVLFLVSSKRLFGQMLRVFMYLAELSTAPYPTPNLNYGPLADLRPARLNHRANFDDDVVTECHTAEALACRRPSSSSTADLDALVYDAPSADEDAPVGRVEAGAGVDDGLGLHCHRVRAGEGGFFWDRERG